MSKKKLTKKASKVLNTLMGKIICPHCGIKLGDGGIGWVVDPTEHTYQVTLDTSGSQPHLDFDADNDPGDTSDGHFYCKDCNKDLDLTDDEVLKILIAWVKENE